MPSQLLTVAVAGALTAPPASSVLATIPAASLSRAGLYRITAYTEYVFGTLGATEQAGLGTTMLCQDSTSALLSPLPVSSQLGLVTEYDLAITLDGTTGIRVVTGPGAGTAGVVYAVVLKAEFIPNGYATF